MSHTYSNNISLSYGDHNAVAALRLHVERYPLSVHPAGSYAGRPRPFKMLQIEEHVLHIVQEGPTINTKMSSRMTEIRQSKYMLPKQKYGELYMKTRLALLQQD
ncbi:hypothetical protein ABEB36_004017 [Hypothenemus hampei]|uniref:Uncharacterized protein n=1 Tax=Hypothenemus hampei TaxID=57062 RepID=A0ABD1F1X3_HYPHA